MRPIHINSAESIFEPFWDPDISGLGDWTFKKESALKSSIEQTWCTVLFKWKEGVVSEYAFTIKREYQNVSSLNMDTLIISASIQKDTMMDVDVSDGEVVLNSKFVCRDGLKHEYKINIENMDKIRHLSISIGSESSDNGTGWFNWIGLSNKNLLENHIESLAGFDEDTWEKHLKPKEYKPEFKPVYGILLNEKDIETLREKADETGGIPASRPYDYTKDCSKDDIPEKYLGEYVNFLIDTRYNRERDKEKYLLKKGEKAAIAGVVNKDPALLRLAARYALVLASCENWEDSFISNFKTSSYDHRCFVASLCLYECAIVLDIAGEMFTDAGKNLILKKMAKEGIGTVNFNTWRYEYIFHCNQMAWFSPGRIYAYAVLLRNFPRVDRYLDIAIDDVIENLNNTIESDGGYTEGPGYFSCVGRDSLLVLYMYSRLKNIDIEKLLPPVLKKTVTFGEVIESTDEKLDFIPICDSSVKVKSSFSDMYKVHLILMAYFFPDSVWPDVYRKHVKNNGMGDSPIIRILDDKIKKKDIKRRNFILMEVTGHAISYRKTSNGYSKIFVLGNKAGAGHTHMDKGSFVYEYEGETFLMDPGICSYDDPISLELKAPDRHNMLVPYGSDKTPYPENPLMKDLIPEASGDNVSFNATMDLSPGWKGWYKEWIRQIKSTGPGEIEIIDKYYIEKGEGVSFMLNTSLDISPFGDSAVKIEGKYGTLSVEIPKECTYKIEELNNPKTRHYRLAIYKIGRKGILNIKMHMETGL